jgi:hypothetical protein
MVALPINFVLYLVSIWLHESSCSSSTNSTIQERIAIDRNAASASAIFHFGLSLHDALVYSIDCTGRVLIYMLASRPFQLSDELEICQPL